MNKILFRAVLILVLSISSLYAVGKEYKKGDLINTNGIRTEKSSGQLANGVEKIFQKPNILAAVFQYKNGKSHGIQKFYDEAGKLATDAMYENGVENGVAKIYFADGKVSTETHFKNGLKHGMDKSYDHSGSTQSVVIYDNGRAVEGYYYNKNGDSQTMSRADLLRTSEQ